MIEWVSSRNAAKLLGIQTSTLRKWRAQGKGPKGAVRVKKNHVVYPVDELRRFREDLARSIPDVSLGCR